MVNVIAAEVVGIAITVLLLYRLEQWSAHAKDRQLDK